VSGFWPMVSGRLIVRITPHFCPGKALGEREQCWGIHWRPSTVDIV